MVALLVALTLTWWTPAQTERHLERTGIAWSFTDGKPDIDRVVNARCKGFGARRAQRWNRFRCRITPGTEASRHRPYLINVYLGGSRDEILVLFLRYV